MWKWPGLGKSGGDCGELETRVLYKGFKFKILKPGDNCSIPLSSKTLWFVSSSQIKATGIY